MKNTNIKRALVLSGGGSKGAFQVGALNYLIDTLKLSFDVAAGVSVGALNAVMIAQGKLAELNQLWSTLTNDKVYHIYDTLFTKLLKFFRSNTVDLYPIIRRGYMFDSAPLKKLIIDSITPWEFKMKLRVGMVNLNSGMYEVIDENTESLYSYILASASEPLYFPTVSINQGNWVDGGLKNITPLKDAIDALKLFKHTEPPELYIILTSPLSISGMNVDNTNPIQVLLRTMDIMLDEIYKNDLRTCIRINESPTSSSQIEVKLHLIIPPYNYTNPLTFDPSITANRKADGFKAAQDILDEGEIKQTFNF